MAVKIRLSRIGKKNSPCWRIVALDSRKKRDGAFLDNLGTYDPLKHEIVHFHYDRVNDWIAKGAECSPSVIKIIKMHKQVVAKSS